MKKLIALLLVLTMAVSLVACGGAEEKPAETEAPAAEGEAAVSTETGSVYYLNFKPEADAAWQKLAAAYTAETGVEVKVVTAAGGNYADTLNAEMAKDTAPTLFNCGNAQSLKDWADYTLDLTGTAFANELATNDFNLYDENGALKAVGYCYESYGIIVNVDLLNAAGYELADITNFETLKAVADDIHARAAELGFDAFSSAGLDSSSSWRFSGHLANMPLFYEFRDDGVTTHPAEITGAYLYNFRAIWDLYITDSSADVATLATSTGDESKALFTEGKAVFHQQGSWEYAGLTEAGMTNLAMIPIYCGVEGEEQAGLCSGTENCWAVNAQASEADIQATLDFIYWVVTSDAGTQMLADEFGAVPFKAAKTPENVFCANANQMVADGKYTVTWAFNHTPNVDAWRATVVTALTKYSVDPSDANWADVVSAFVDGWAIEYTMANG